MATPAQMAANRMNAQRSTGPKTIEGKEAARRHALKHGLTGGGVVLPGEDEQEVAIRERTLKDQLVAEGDVLGGVLVRQFAIASIRVERAFRHESALAAERMRKAPEVFDDERLSRVQAILGEIELDPVTIRRRLLAVPEGVDALIVRLRALRAQTDSTRIIAWDQAWVRPGPRSAAMPGPPSGRCSRCCRSCGSPTPRPRNGRPPPACRPSPRQGDRRKLVADASGRLDTSGCHGIGTPTPCAPSQPEPHGVEYHPLAPRKLSGQNAT